MHCILFTLLYIERQLAVCQETSDAVSGIDCIATYFFIIHNTEVYSYLQEMWPTVT